MADIINLRRARKEAARQRDADDADARRVAHGVTKGERQANKTRGDKTKRDLDHHRLPSGDRK